MIEKLISLADEMLKGERAEKIGISCGGQLGRGLSVLIDILNPERIVIGSIFVRSENLLREGMERIIKKEALPSAAACCKIVPDALGEQMGDYAAIATTLL